MKMVSKSLILAGVISLAVPNIANARGFKHTVNAPISTPVKIEIVLSEDMQHRANNLPTRLSDRNSGASNGPRSGFANNGYYGDKALKNLSTSLEKRLATRFEKKGITVSNEAPVTMRVTIENAKNNRPTFRQLSVQPSLSFRSFAVGGAEVSAELIAENGESLGTMSYSYFETNFDFRRNQFGPIWFDAKRSFGFFANRAAKTLTN